MSDDARRMDAPPVPRDDAQMRGFLHSLRSRLGRTPPSPHPAPPRAVHPAQVDVAHLRAPCLDVRDPDIVAGGIVKGAIVLDPAHARLHARRLPPDAVVLANSDAEALDLTLALREIGCSGARASVGGIAAWEAAGHPIVEPAWKSPLPPGHAVALRPEVAHARGLPEGLSGWVQDVRWENTTLFQFDVLLVNGDALTRVDGLPEEALTSLGPRGAAGLGAVF